ncbi:MAG: sulfatase [Planctomycetota bacterium]
MANTPLSRRDFLGLVVGGAASALLRRTTLGQDASGQRPPNFIIIFTDDQGYQDVGCFGSPDIKTPCMDRMAAEGKRFSDFYAAAPVCTPSRAALMTGCYPHRVGLPSVLSPRAGSGINPDEITLAELLKTRGYATLCVGKWHLGHLPPFLPTRHGFDHYFGIPYSNDMDGEKAHFPPIPLLRDETVIEQPADQRTLTERYTEEAIKFIAANKDRPFFLYLPHTFPHVPLHVSDRFASKSKRGLYGDVIECIDWSTGRILDTLREHGLDENTLVVFTSDNGPWLIKKEHGGSALPLRSGKATTFEGGMREPCIMWGPGRIPAGTVCSEMATTMDIYPTFARLAGADVPTDRIIDGKDIWSLVTGQPGAKTPHEYFFYGFQSVRSGKWKLHKWEGADIPKGGKKSAKGEKPEPPRKGPTLYDLNADIGEKNDVAAEHPDVVKCLLDALQKHEEDIQKNARPPGKLPPDSPYRPDDYGVYHIPAK